jgi:DNA mismatch repair ATPase MutS
MYPNVKSHHFIVDRGEDNHMIFRYQLRDGVTREENYGIDSLVLTGWDDSIISEARGNPVTIAVYFFDISFARLLLLLGISLKLQAEKSQQQSPSSDLDRRYHEIAERLVSLQYSTMSETALRAKVASLKAALLALDEESATLGAESMGAHSD